MQEHPPLSEREIGVVTHYFNHLGVAGVHLTEPVDVGDHIHVLGHTTDFEQDVGAMQIEHHEIRHANPGDDVGIRVVDHVREHDIVYKFTREDVGDDEHAL